MKNLIAVLFALLSLNAFSQIPDYVPTDGLVGWYPFNGNANDESGVSANGEMFSLEAAEDRFGNPNSAFYFSGSGCAPHIETNIDFQGSSEGMTISYWLNRQGNGCNYPRLFGFWSGGNNPQSWGMAWGNSAVLDYMGESPANDQWHHVLVTLDADSIHAYLNGELKGAYGSAKQPPLASYMSIGRMTHPAYDAFNGYMDDIGIWNRVLLPEEIQSMYDSDENPSIPGCMDEAACNYNPEATEEDGGCVYSGCNDPSACNFNGADICDIDCIYPAIGEDCTAGEGLCGPGTYWDDASQTCRVTIPGDVDFNGCLSIEDLLGSLAIYNLCFDAEAIAFTCGVDVVHYDGYDYQTVQIGDQCWFAENLRSANYSDGSAIPLLLSAEEWQSQSGPAVTFRSDSAQTVLWGAYYNWESLAQEASVCPIGWHVPSHLEWSELEIALGMDEETAVNFGYRGGIPEVPIALSTSGTNSSGFSAVGAGFRYEHGGWDPNYTAFWTTSEVANPLNAVSRKLFYLQNITAVPDLKTWGLSVRCLRDVE